MNKAYSNFFLVICSSIFLTNQSAVAMQVDESGASSTAVRATATATPEERLDTLDEKQKALFHRLAHLPKQIARKMMDVTPSLEDCASHTELCAHTTFTRQTATSSSVGFDVFSITTSIRMQIDEEVSNFPPLKPLADRCFESLRPVMQNHSRLLNEICRTWDDFNKSIPMELIQREGIIFRASRASSAEEQTRLTDSILAADREYFGTLRSLMQEATNIQDYPICFFSESERDTEEKLERTHESITRFIQASTI